ncbi:MAG: polymer-forming cytoskeletal protein [Chloroflexi bacterium]|nr:polymer-forming cytoskeletal protein [Chloroflexota bacterium]MCC6892437.1 polymer-forming cytoskeletal protein [Anaerolineae bacterium]
MSFFGNRRQVEPSASPALEQPVQVTKPALPQPAIGFDSVLGPNSVLEGTLQSNANIRLDGTFSGTLEINGNILVGETAKIKADINARNISVAGAVRGNITGKKVQVLRTGRVWGDIRATALTTEEGAFIDGKITMVGHESSAEPLASAPETVSADADLTQDLRDAVAQADEPLDDADVPTLDERDDSTPAVPSA